MRKTIEEVVAEATIKDIQIRYCRACDRMDFDLLRSCFHPDATTQYGFFGGGIDDFIEGARQQLPHFVGTTHNTGNQIVEVDGNGAWAEHYTVATHRIAADEIGNRVRRQHRATFDQHQMQAHAQIRHPLGALGRIERGWRAHHQACGRQDAIAVGDFHRFVDFACRVEIIGGDDEFLQAACSRRSLRSWKNSTPSRKRLTSMSREVSISPTISAILEGRK